MGQYTPTNTVPSSCPTVGSGWQAASALPPTPDEELCACMAEAVTCTVSQSVTDEEIEELFGLVCGLPGNPCAGIALSPANGTYGAYSMCSYDRQQQQASNSNGCDFSGSATRQSPVQPTGACSSKIEEVGDGTNPTASGGSSGGSSSSSSSSQGAAAGGTIRASLNIGSLQVGIYLVCAIMSGAGMILL